MAYSHFANLNSKTRRGDVDHNFYNKMAKYYNPVTYWNIINIFFDLKVVTMVLY